MLNTFLIADLHFGDESILCYENRPFKDVKEMDEELIKRWNQIVGKEDKVFVLGDFGAGGYEKSILDKLNGSKILIKGNHDIYASEKYRKMGFAEVYDYPIILDDFWILSHDMMYVNSNMPYANVFGHVHNNPMVKDYSSHHYCVSAERINYTPISFEEIKVMVRSFSKKDK